MHSVILYLKTSFQSASLHAEQQQQQLEEENQGYKFSEQAWCHLCQCAAANVMSDRRTMQWNLKNRLCRGCWFNSAAESATATKIKHLFAHAFLCVCEQCVGKLTLQFYYQFCQRCVAVYLLDQRKWPVHLRGMWTRFCNHRAVHKWCPSHRSKRDHTAEDFWYNFKKTICQQGAKFLVGGWGGFCRRW